MELKEKIFEQFAASGQVAELKRAHQNSSTTIHLKEMVSGALSSYAAPAISALGGVHIFVAEDRDAAAYMLSDFYALLGQEHIFFLPTSYKRSILYSKEDANGIVQRTSTLSRLRSGVAPYTVVCTYPEALAECVADSAVMQREQLEVRVGDKLSVEFLSETLESMGFVKVNFVFEPGQ